MGPWWISLLLRTLEAVRKLCAHGWYQGFESCEADSVVRVVCQDEAQMFLVISYLRQMPGSRDHLHLQERTSWGKAVAVQSYFALSHHGER